MLSWPWNHRAAFLEGEHLCAVHQAFRQPLDLGKLRSQTDFPLRLELYIFYKLVEFDELQKFGQVDLCQQFFNLPLPFDLLQLLAFYVEAELLDIG
jgi:hypothetical protein